MDSEYERRRPFWSAFEVPYILQGLDPPWFYWEFGEKPPLNREGHRLYALLHRWVKMDLPYEPIIIGGLDVFKLRRFKPADVLSAITRRAADVEGLGIAECWRITHHYVFRFSDGLWEIGPQNNPGRFKGDKGIRLYALLLTAAGKQHQYPTWAILDAYADGRYDESIIAQGYNVTEEERARDRVRKALRAARHRISQEQPEAAQLLEQGTQGRQYVARPGFVWSEVTPPPQ
jgi:hypothetical protein